MWDKMEEERGQKDVHCLLHVTKYRASQGQITRLKYVPGHLLTSILNSALSTAWGTAERKPGGGRYVKVERIFFFPLEKKAEAVCSCYCSSVLELHLPFSHTPGTALTALCEKEPLEQASPPPAELCKANSPSKG